MYFVYQVETKKSLNIHALLIDLPIFNLRCKMALLKKLSGLVLLAVTVLFFQNCSQVNSILLLSTQAKADPLNKEDVDMKRRRSLIVTLPSLMNSLSTSRFHMARLLGEVGKYETPKRSPQMLLCTSFLFLMKITEDMSATTKD